MSTASTITPMALPLIAGQVRAYFAPVNRSTEAPTIFDPALASAWVGHTPAAPWIDLGWVSQFVRTSETTVGEVAAGMPSMALAQAYTQVGATVSFRFGAWTKLNMALATASQHMNVLAAASTSPPIASGAKAFAAVALLSTSSAVTLYLASQAATPIAAGDLVVVDIDYAQQTGYVGAGVSGGYVQSAAAVGGDVDYVRRVSFNVGRVTAVGSDGGLQLASPLLAGTPTGTMKVQQVLGFVDREGGNFLQEWSALFAMTGAQGEQLCFYYPRLQVCEGAQEVTTSLAGTLSVVEAIAKFRALPVVDGNDSAQCVCYRTYYPARFTYV